MALKHTGCFLYMCAWLVTKAFAEDQKVAFESTHGKVVLSRTRRFAAIGYLTVILVLLNTVLLIISNVVINK